jgi:hypothetical protein
MSQKLVPIKGSDRSFSIVRRRVQIAPNKKNKSGFSYENQDDLHATRALYSSMLNTIPVTPGALIVYKKLGHNLIPVEILRCDENVRQKFSSPKGDLHRFHLLLRYLNEGFDAVVVQLARPAS